MLDNIGFFIGLIFLIAGAVLLYSGASSADPSQSGEMIGGATLLSLGLIVMGTVLRNRWEWRKEYRRYRNG